MSASRIDLPVRLCFDESVLVEPGLDVVVDVVQ
jgi:hypothetical protein